MDTGMTGAQINTALGRQADGVEVLSETDATTELGVGRNGTALTLREIAHFVRYRFAKNTTAPIATDEVGCGAHILLEDTNSNAGLIGLVDTDGSSLHLNIRILSGEFAIYRGNTQIRTLGFWPVPNTWYYIELKQVINDTTGSWTFRVDGVTIDSDSSVDTRNSGNGIAGFLQIEGVTNNTQTKFDNIYAYHNNGGDVVDFLGIIHVGSLHPDADGDDEVWSTSSGTDSFALVNETAPHDDDTDYIQSGTTGQRTLFTYDDVLAGLTNFHGIHLQTVVRETDGTDFTLINTFKQGVTLYPESAEAIAGTSFENIDHVLDQDPDTAADWTASGINALQAGVEVG